MFAHMLSDYIANLQRKSSEKVWLDEMRWAIGVWFYVIYVLYLSHIIAHEDALTDSVFKYYWINCECVSLKVSLKPRMNIHLVLCILGLVREVVLYLLPRTQLVAFILFKYVIAHLFFIRLLHVNTRNRPISFFLHQYQYMACLTGWYPISAYIFLK